MSVDARIREFCAQQREWLEQELHEEQDEAAAIQEASNSSKKSKSSQQEEQDDGRTARVLSQLEATEISVGLYGRTVVQLSRRKTAAAAAGDGASGEAGSGTSKDDSSSMMLLPAHRFTTGDEVEIRSKSGSGNNNNGGAISTGGVVNEVTDTSISVALFSGARGNKSQQQQNSKQQQAGGGGGSKRNSKNTSNDASSLDEDGGLGNPPYALLPTSSIEVHKKLVAALNELEKHGIDHPTAGHVVKALFQREEGVVVASPPPTSNGSKSITSSATGLDPSQLEAIEFALAADNNRRPVALVHGPPGTGKTTTIVELIRRAVTQHGMTTRVLVAAPSNVAVDNVLERLVAANNNNTTMMTTKSALETANNDDGGDDAKLKRRDVRNNKKNNKMKLKVVRLGHPARLQPSILPYSLEALVQSADGTEVVADARQELQSLLRMISKDKSKKGGGDYRKRAAAYREIKLLRKEVRQREEQVVQELLQQANVVLATCVGAANRLLSGGNNKKDKTGLTFDLVVIDEAAQALEAACWIPALRAGPSGKLVLAGDHCQLPPTIKSHRPQVVQGLSKTMFERLMELYGDDLSSSSDNSKNGNDKETKVAGHGLGRVSRMLRTQYRMHQNISDWSSNALYGGQLQTHKSVASRTLAQLGASNGDSNDTETINKNGDDSDGVSQTVLLLIDTAGCGMYEQKNEAGSRSNEMEGQIVAQHVRKLLALGVKQEQIAVITPYNGQVELLRTMLLPEAPKLEIRSVDGFQGGEREAVVLSLVRSSERGGMDGIGFLRDDRRLNVAVTRAKRHCCVVCDSETVSQSAFVQGLVQWMEEHGESRSALEYMSSEGNTDFQVQSDLAMAEREMERLMKDAAPPPPKGKKSTTHTKSDSQRKDVEEMRKGMLDKVGAFAEKGTPGDKLTLNAELSSYDRRLVHELAEELGIDHCSEGVEGVDRRIILSVSQNTMTTTKDDTIPVATETSVIVTSSSPVNDEVDDSIRSDEEPLASKGASSTFAALGDSDESDEEEATAPDESKTTPEPTMNSLLGSLAEDRAQRNRQATKASNAAATSTTASKPNGKKKKGQKLGGAQKKPAPKKRGKEDDRMDDLDDMAFLDAQIDKVQNAHGRKLDAKGKAYRTVMNGILTPTPRPEPERKRDARSAAALQTKLKAAQDGRKAKPKKKK